MVLRIHPGRQSISLMYNLSFIFSVFFLFSLTGCYLLPGIPGKRSNDTIVINLDMGGSINPGLDGIAQPLKICLYETTSGEWVPERLYEGIICQKPLAEENVIKYEQYILLPGEKRVYRSQKPVEQLRWVLVGAEFQRSSASERVIKSKVLPRQNLDITVYADNTDLSITTNKK